LALLGLDSAARSEKALYVVITAYNQLDEAYRRYETELETASVELEKLTEAEAEANAQRAQRKRVHKAIKQARISLRNARKREKPVYSRFEALKQETTVGPAAKTSFGLGRNAATLEALYTDLAAAISTAKSRGGSAAAAMRTLEERLESTTGH
jgi:hypothetical protein